MKAARIQELKAYIKAHRQATNEELCEAMDISMSTLRRDLAGLQEEGFIKKVYGGVAYSEPSPVPPYEYRDEQNAPEKNTVGRIAAGLIRDNDVIFIDSGTTTPYILNYITAQNVTVLTNNATIVSRALDYPNLSIFVLPGIYYPETMSFCCPDAIEFLERYEISKAFLAASGFSSRGATNSAAWEYTLKKYITERVKESYLCIASAKFGISRIITYCGVDQLAGIITEREPDEAMKQLLNEKGVRLITP
ncbi:MAG: DeoR/GlpR transcriptional regulator [Lachnospiraceae bacterium]|nr:DeoR/GlpR transcriptional regulator [Lachnospiraceae bacterium]